MPSTLEQYCSPAGAGGVSRLLKESGAHPRGFAVVASGNEAGAVGGVKQFRLNANICPVAGSLVTPGVALQPGTRFA